MQAPISVEQLCTVLDFVVDVGVELKVKSVICCHWQQIYLTSILLTVCSLPIVKSVKTLAVMEVDKEELSLLKNDVEKNLLIGVVF